MIRTKKSTKKIDTKSTTKQTPTIKSTDKKSTENIVVEKKTVGTYVPVSHHIYYDGRSYRVRASVNGTRYSQTFSSKKKAFAYRKSILSGV
jgi:hypothetical protein